jgi:hypothetical protein
LLFDAAGCTRGHGTPDAAAADAPSADTGRADALACSLHTAPPLVTPPDDIDLPPLTHGDQAGERWEGTRLADGADVVLQLDSAPPGEAPTTGTLLIGAPRDWGTPTSPDEPWPADGDPYMFGGPWHWDGYTYVVEIDQWDGLVGRLHYELNQPYRRWCDLQPSRAGVGDAPTPTRADAHADHGNIPFPNRCFWIAPDGCTWHEASCMAVLPLVGDTAVCTCDPDGCYETPSGHEVHFGFTGDVATGDELVLRRVP